MGVEPISPEYETGIINHYTIPAYGTCILTAYLLVKFAAKSLILSIKKLVSSI